MRVALEDVAVSRGACALSCSGVFEEGIHLVTGRVGSGKTTLALLLAGLLKPTAGSVRREGIGTLTLSLQNPEYHVTEATVRAEIASYGADPDGIADRCGLAGRIDDDPFHLSRGELKRLHLACLFAAEWDLLVLDEPFSSLDCVQKRLLCRRLEERDAGITVVFTHERQVLPGVDYLWEVGDGRASCLGPVREAIGRWRYAPPYLKLAIEEGRVPENIRFEDARKEP
ncbi:MAG: energy-coupling factor transport system ATP-binding protein [Methanofollis sp.]|nr:energy-coupling factor transport system ATP-binding protein [Methanofollis sp.]